MIDRPSFIQRALRAFAWGLPGVAALPWLIDPPEGVPAAALAVGPAILLIAAACAGAWASVRIGVRSSLILRDRIVPLNLVRAVAIGLVAGLAVAIVDQATLSLWRGDTTSPPSLVETLSPSQFAIGVLYGGFTEEIVFRWGLGSALAALAILVLPRPLSITLSIVLAAALFSIAHLPAAFADAETWPIGSVVRTLGWNALLGLLFGTLFVRDSLEAAILAHIGFHCGAALTLAL